MQKERAMQAAQRQLASLKATEAEVSIVATPRPRQVIIIEDSDEDENENENENGIRAGDEILISYGKQFWESRKLMAQFRENFETLKVKDDTALLEG